MAKVMVYKYVATRPVLVDMPGGESVVKGPRDEAFLPLKNGRFKVALKAGKLMALRTMEDVVEEPEVVVPAAATEVEAEPEEDETGAGSVEDLPLSALDLDSSFVELLSAEGVDSVGALQLYGDEDLLDMKGIGPSALSKIRAALSKIEEV